MFQYVVKSHFAIVAMIMVCFSAYVSSVLAQADAVGEKGDRQGWALEVTTDQPGHIHFVEVPTVKVVVAVADLLGKARDVPLALRVVDVAGKEVFTTTRNLNVKSGEKKKETFSLPSQPGYFYVTATLGEGDEAQQAEGAFGVVPKPIRFGRRDPESFFGMTIGYPQWAARIGVHWARSFFFWQWQEIQPGKYGSYKAKYDDFLKHGIDVMMLLDYREPAWLKNRVDAEGMPTKEALSRYADWVRQAVRDHPDVAVFEIQNEPDLELGTSRGLSTDKAIDFYTRIVKVAAPIIRKEAPKARIAGCSHCGAVFGQSYSRPVLKDVGKMFDIYVPHIYASPRIFGPGRKSLFPEDNREADKIKAEFKLLRQLGLSQLKLWMGEKGWAISDKAPLWGKESIALANCAARSLIIAKSAGMKKFIWHMQVHGVEERGGRYALWRGKAGRNMWKAHPYQPMPGAVAYANVAYHLDHTKSVKTSRLAGGVVELHVFLRPETDTAVAALWSTRGEFHFKANWPKHTRLFDLYGRAVPVDNIVLNGSPIFIQSKSSEVENLLAGIKNAKLMTTTPFAILAASLRNVNTVSLELANQTNDPLDVNIRILDQVKKIHLPVSSKPYYKQITLPSPATSFKGASLPITVAKPAGKGVTVQLPTNLIPILHAKKITVDGKFKDWAGIPAMVLKTKSHVLPPDPAIGWGGPEDLSMRIRIAWDEKNLYLLVRVMDDVHYAPGGREFWQEDGLQILFDVMNNAFGVSICDPNDREYGVSINDNGVRTFQTIPKGRANFPAAGWRKGTQTLYEMAFPWSQLGRKPKAGVVFSLNVAATDNDSTGMHYWMGITNGIVEAKRPGAFRDFYLKAPADSPGEQP